MKTKTFAVIGLGRFGMAVASQLFNMGYEVLAVDKNMELVNAAADNVTKAVCGDAKEERVLKALGINNYDCVVVSIGDDITDSILITLMLKEIGIKQIVAKARDSQHKRALEKIGADSVVIPEHEAGVKTALGLVSSNIMDIINLSEEYSIADIAVSKHWTGKSIAELGIREKYGVNIVAVKSRSGVNVSPSAMYVFDADDVAVVIGTAENINLLNE